jgi:hypothetical protein
MRVSVKSNIDEVTKWTTNVQKKQIPFATSNAINKTLFQLRKEMMKQTVKKLDRPTPFTQKGFLVQMAKKTNLRGMLFVKEEVEKYLKYQINGGVRSTGKQIPVPYIDNARLNKYGNVMGKRSGLIKKDTQFFGTIKGVNGIWERQKQDNRLKLIYALTRTASYEPKFPFYVIADKFVAANFDKNFAEKFAHALRTAK